MANKQRQRSAAAAGNLEVEELRTWIAPLYALHAHDPARCGTVRGSPSSGRRPATPGGSRTLGESKISGLARSFIYQHGRGHSPGRCRLVATLPNHRCSRHHAGRLGAALRRVSSQASGLQFQSWTSPCSFCRSGTKLGTQRLADRAIDLQSAGPATGSTGSPALSSNTRQNRWAEPSVAPASSFFKHCAPLLRCRWRSTKAVAELF